MGNVLDGGAAIGNGAIPGCRRWDGIPAPTSTKVSLDLIIKY